VKFLIINIIYQETHETCVTESLTHLTSTHAITHHSPQHFHSRHNDMSTRDGPSSGINGDEGIEERGTSMVKKGPNEVGDDKKCPNDVGGIR
jgi:hypothetical protein